MYTLFRFAMSIVFVAASSGCEVKVEVKPAGQETKPPPAQPWQVFATNKTTQKLEYWWSWHESRSECERSVRFDLKESVHAAWYTYPAGCIYTGSESRFVLYGVNKWNIPEELLCIAMVKPHAKTDRSFVVVLRGYPHETADWYCVMPEKAQGG